MEVLTEPETGAAAVVAAAFEAALRERLGSGTRASLGSAQCDDERLSDDVLPDNLTQLLLSMLFFACYTLAD